VEGLRDGGALEQEDLIGQVRAQRGLGPVDGEIRLALRYRAAAVREMNEARALLKQLQAEAAAAVKRAADEEIGRALANRMSGWLSGAIMPEPQPEPEPEPEPEPVVRPAPARASPEFGSILSGLGGGPRQPEPVLLPRSGQGLSDRARRLRRAAKSAHRGTGR